MDWAGVGDGGRCRGAWLLSIFLTACSPVPDPSAGLTPEEAVKLIEQVAPSNLSPDTVAEAFALGSRSTDVQRDDLTQALVGHSGRVVNPGV